MRCTQGVFRRLTGWVLVRVRWEGGRAVFFEGGEVVDFGFEFVLEVRRVLEPEGEEVKHPAHGAGE
jgi:hypothetical protein